MTDCSMIPYLPTYLACFVLYCFVLFCFTWARVVSLDDCLELEDSTVYADLGVLA